MVFQPFAKRVADCQQNVLRHIARIAEDEFVPQQQLAEFEKPIELHHNAGLLLTCAYFRGGSIPHLISVKIEKTQGFAQCGLWMDLGRDQGAPAAPPSGLNPGQIVKSPAFDAVAVPVRVSAPFKPLGHIDQVLESGFGQHAAGVCRSAADAAHHIDGR